MSLRLKHPSTHLCIGASQYGKSYHLYNIIRNLKSLYPPHIDFKTIYYLYGEVDAIKNIPCDIAPKLSLVNGIPDDFSVLLSCSKPAIIIFDDLYTQVFNKPEIVNLILNSVHHSDLTCIITTQVAFPREKYARTLALNAQYIHFLPSPRMNASFTHLASQVTEPEDRKVLLESYRDACKSGRTAFLMDLHPATANWARYRTHIFDSDECCVVYCPRRFYDECKSSAEVTLSDGAQGRLP